jgi:hypothetical protein
MILQLLVRTVTSSSERGLPDSRASKLPEEHTEFLSRWVLTRAQIWLRACSIGNAIMSLTWLATKQRQGRPGGRLSAQVRFREKNCRLLPSECNFSGFLAHPCVQSVTVYWRRILGVMP